MILEHYAGGSITAKNTILIVLTIDTFFTSCNFWHLVIDFIMVSISADLSLIQETCTKDKYIDVYKLNWYSKLWLFQAKRNKCKYKQSNVIEDIFLCFDFIFELYKKSEKKNNLAD